MCFVIHIEDDIYEVYLVELLCVLGFGEPSFQVAG